MRRFSLLALILAAALAAWLAAGLSTRASDPPPIYVNEFLADNDAVIADEYGEYNDVLELYNAGDTDINLSGMYLTDNLGNPTKFQITVTVPITLPAGGYIYFWADSTPEQGIYHTNFSLKKEGEAIGLFDTDANGNAPIDTYEFGPQATDVSEGRCPDGGSDWLFYASPTIGATNEPCGLPPVITGTARLPEYPAADEPVTVTAMIADDGVIVTATLWYSAGIEWQSTPMLAQADIYSATIPGQPQNTAVEYYVEAADDAGWTSTDPAGAPQYTYGYIVGYQPLPIAVNEIMADNTSTLEDPDEPGEYPDWLELHNYGAEDIDLGGLYLTDSDADPTQFLIAAGLTISAGGYLVFYADDDTEQGPLHTNFKLSANGETVAVYGGGGLARVDGVQFPALDADISYGRWPDGIGAWDILPCASPSATNLCTSEVYLPFVGRGLGFGSAPIPLRISCGSSTPYTAHDGTVYRADRLYTQTAGYGAIGGEPDLPDDWWEDNPVGGTADPYLYKVQRVGWQEYRASRIPNGPYLLTLRFQEQVVHGPGFVVFDLVAEGQTLLDDLDIYAEAGRYYAMNARFAVTVTDTVFNLLAIPSAGRPALAALELVPRLPDALPPAVPSGLSATPSYNAVLLDWTSGREDDLAGYHIYRADQPQGPYTRVNAKLIHLSKYQNTSTPGDMGFYRVSAVDVYGNESAPAGYVAAAALDPYQALLPLYQLEVSPQNLAILEADPFLDERVPATFTWQCQTLPVEARFRGTIGRTFDKKSWKIVFDDEGSPFPNHDRINVNANWADPTLMHAKLANVLFEEAGIRPPGAEMVLLMLNGEYRGLYTRNEQVDEGFLISSGRSPTASIYKVVGRFPQILPDLPTYQYWYEKETNTDLPYDDLIAFLELINDTPDGQFAAAISQVLDVHLFLDHLAIIVLTANDDSATRNIYLVHDLETGMWELVPYDLDWGFARAGAPIDLGTVEHPDSTGDGSLLRSRVLAVPEFRTYYCDRVAEYMNTLFGPGQFDPKIAELYYAIRADAVRDWRKLGWEDSTDFLGSLSSISEFASDRRESLLHQMQTFCP